MSKAETRFPVSVMEKELGTFPVTNVAETPPKSDHSSFKGAKGVSLALSIFRTVAGGTLGNFYVNND